MARCAECGTRLPGDRTCRNLFEELIRREYEQEFGPEAWKAHGLTVSAYVLQHPRSHPPTSYVRARAVLEAVFEEGMDPASAEKALRQLGAGSGRTGRYRSTRQELISKLGMPERPPGYRVTVEDLYAQEPQGHEERVRRWAKTALEDQNAFLAEEDR